LLFRTDATITLKIAAYEALMELIKSCPKDCYSVVKDTVLKLQTKIPDLVDLALASAVDATQLRDLISRLCVTLNSVLQKIFNSDALSGVSF
jgi:hypothetical protein